jgi:hypothetical protein
LGYFEQMAAVDLFVLLDDVQYTQRDWRNRNRIKTAAGSIWLTVPVQHQARAALIKDILIDYQRDWPRKHLRSIELGYSRCRYLQPLFSELQEVLQHRHTHLVELDCELIRLLCRYLAIDTPIAYASEAGWVDTADGTDRRLSKNDRLIGICRHFGITMLYEGARGAGFIDTAYFRRHGIEVVFQDYRHPTYRQAFGEFISHQSAIDLIMNTGPEAAAILLSSPLPEAFRDRRK